MISIRKALFHTWVCIYLSGLRGDNRACSKQGLPTARLPVPRVVGRHATGHRRGIESATGVIAKSAEAKAKMIKGTNLSGVNPFPRAPGYPRVSQSQ
jgi:hypothetical protein